MERDARFTENFLVRSGISNSNSLHLFVILDSPDLLGLLFCRSLCASMYVTLLI